MAEQEISGYASDGESFGHTMTSSRLDSESCPLLTGEGSKRSVSDWVRSAQAMLQTPQKSFARQSKTPEDSAKKRRKFQRFEILRFCSKVTLSEQKFSFFSQPEHRTVQRRNYTY